MIKLKVIDLFAGIGGFGLGLERTGGFETVAQCEIDPFCRRVLAKHWPNVRRYHDVRTLTADTLASDGISVDVITGGFPCQDISVAGHGAGIEGERSGLWSHMARLVDEIRPEFLIVENSPNLLAGQRGAWFGRILGDLAALGYDAEWHCIPASHVGASHERDRVWIIAYSNANGFQERMYVAGIGGEEAGRKFTRSAADRVPSPPEPANSNEGEFSLGRTAGRVGRIIQSIPRHRAWPITPEPVLERGADGIPDRLDRVGACGNSVVPIIPQLIGRAILQARAA